MERMVYPGEFYRHFKNKLYQIVAVARHSETGERMVVYQALYGDYQVYVRPYEMFVSPVDREKYPDAPQQYRFERVVFGGDGTAAAGFRERGPEADGSGREDWPGNDGSLGTGSEHAPGTIPEAAPKEPNPALLEFLDSNDFQTRMECLHRLKKTAAQQDIDSICMVLDIGAHSGTIPEQVAAIERYLKLQNHFDGGHLR